MAATLNLEAFRVIFGSPESDRASREESYPYDQKTNLPDFSDQCLPHSTIDSERWERCFLWGMGDETPPSAAEDPGAQRAGETESLESRGKQM